jgi:uncharacterized protein YdbL (DUF1318 family)
MKKFLITMFMVFAVQSAWAIDIHAAKDQGLVGESKSGYLAAVKSPANDDVKALIADVNRKRKAQFEKTAQKTSTTMAQVQNRFYELAIQKTHAGHYYQDAGGKWVKK